MTDPKEPVEEPADEPAEPIDEDTADAHPVSEPTQEGGSSSPE